MSGTKTVTALAKHESRCVFFSLYAKKSTTMNCLAYILKQQTKYIESIIPRAT